MSYKYYIGSNGSNGSNLLFQGRLKVLDQYKKKLL